MSKPKKDPAYWPKQDPVFAHECLASIKAKCQRKVQHEGIALSDEECAYLAEAIEKIEHGVPADRALCLTASRRKKGSPRLSDENITIYNRVEELNAQGLSQRRAYQQVAREYYAGTLKDEEDPKHKRIKVIVMSKGGNKRRRIGEKAVEKIHRAIRSAVTPTRERPGK